MSASICCAAPMVFNVAALTASLLCSAMIRIVTSLSPSKNPGFGPEFFNQRAYVRQLHAGGAPRRLRDLQRLQARLHVDAEFFRTNRLERLLLRLHDVCQSDV